MIERWWAMRGQHLREVMKASASAFVVKAFAALITLVFNVVIARKMGASGVGLFFLALASATVLSVICRAGTYNALVRLVASFCVKEEWGRLRALYRESVIFTALTSAVGALALWWLSAPLAIGLFGKPDLAVPLQFAALIVVPLTLTAIHAAFFQGAKRVVLSLLLQNVSANLMVTAVLLAFAASLTAADGILLYAAAGFATLAAAFLFLRLQFPQMGRAAAQQSPGLLRRVAAPMFPISLINQILLPWAPILLLGIWADSSEVGLFGVANRIALLIGFVLVAVNSIAAPKFAELHHLENPAELSIVVQHASRLMALAATPVLLIMIALPQPLLGIFGEEFRAAWPLLIILAAGQFVNVVSGSVGMLLMMTGNAALYRSGALAGATAGIVLALILIPEYGALGAAISAAVAQSIVNLLGVYFAKSKLGILTVPWPQKTESNGK